MTGGELDIASCNTCNYLDFILTFNNFVLLFIKYKYLGTYVRR